MPGVILYLFSSAMAGFLLPEQSGKHSSQKQKGCVHITQIQGKISPLAFG